MKKSKFSFIIPTFVALTALYAIGSSCAPPNEDPIVTPAVTCDSNNTIFKQLYNQTDLASAIQIRDLYDNKTYEYTFSVNTNRKICAVGLESSFASTPYTIEIYNVTDATMLLNTPIVFNTGATDYKSITPISITAAKTYTIRRKTTSLAGSQTKGLGFSATPLFPITLNGLTITASDMYDTPGSSTSNVQNKILPFIDIVFE